MGSKWSHEEIEFLKNNYLNMTYKELSNHLNRSKSAIDLKINRLGLKKSKYTYNHSYFKIIDTPEKAYWLGFIAADGCVSVNERTNSGELCIKLKGSDGPHLQKFNKSINGNIDVSYGTQICNMNNKQYCFSQIRLYSIEMVQDLISHGIIPNKTHHLLFPDIKTEYISHFIRGYFDGDGCITQSNHKNGKSYIKCDFTGIDNSFFTKLRSILYENNIKSYFCFSENKATRLVIGGLKNVDIFLKYIYKDATIYLDRKYERKNELYRDLNIEQRLLRQIEKSGSFILSEKENGKAEMLIRVEGCEQNYSHTQSVETEPSNKEEYNVSKSSRPLTDNAEGEKVRRTC